MPDKWDSADGQTHDESELIATDREIADHRVILSRRPDNVLYHITTFEMLRVLARLDAAERERDALKTKLAVKQTEQELVYDIDAECYTPSDPILHITEEIDWIKMGEMIAAHVHARVAEAVRPWREALAECVDFLRSDSEDEPMQDDAVECPECGTLIGWPVGIPVTRCRQCALDAARRLMEEADRD